MLLFVLSDIDSMEGNVLPYFYVLIAFMLLSLFLFKDVENESNDG